MIPNGKEMEYDGHHLVFYSEPSACGGCFFEDNGSCPDCDQGIWVDASPSSWNTGKPTEEGWYLIEYENVWKGSRHEGTKSYRAVKRYRDEQDDYIYEDGGIRHEDIWKPVRWQKITPQ